MKELKRSPLEAVVILVIGIGIGLAGNRLNADGLVLSRNYFPTHAPVAKAPPAIEPAPGHRNADAPPLNGTDSQANGNGAKSILPDPGDSAVAARLSQYGLRVIQFPKVLAAFEDPARSTNCIVFIDARNDDRYQEGHIPGAYQFDHYYMDRYLHEVLPIVFQAEKVIVYCGGGDCEDSEFAAIELLNNGADASRLFIYLGGLAEWKQNGRPVEIGARDSGFIVGGEG